MFKRNPSIEYYLCLLSDFNMSFEFSQNLLADIQSSQHSQQCISATQTQPYLSSQNQNGLQTIGIHSQNMLANVPLTQQSVKASREKFPRPQNGQGLSQQKHHQLQPPPREATQDSLRPRHLLMSVSQTALSKFSEDWTSSQSRWPRCWRRDLIT